MQETDKTTNCHRGIHTLLFSRVSDCQTKRPRVQIRSSARQLLTLLHFTCRVWEAVLLSIELYIHLREWGTRVTSEFLVLKKGSQESVSLICLSFSLSSHLCLWSRVNWREEDTDWGSYDSSSLRFIFLKESISWSLKSKHYFPFNWRASSFSFPSVWCHIYSDSWLCHHHQSGSSYSYIFLVALFLPNNHCH